MKVSDEMVEAALKVFFVGIDSDNFDEDEKIDMKRAIEAAMKVYAMERLVDAGAEQMEDEVENG